MFYSREHGREKVILKCFIITFEQLQENVITEIGEKGAIKWYFVTKISLDRISANEEMD